MLVRALQQRAIVVAVRRIQERGQEYADVHTSIIQCSQDIAVIFATETMEMGVNARDRIPISASPQRSRRFSTARRQFVWATGLAVNAMYRANEDASEGISIERLLVSAL